MKLYRVKMIIGKKGKYGRREIYSRDEKTIVGNVETAEKVYSEYVDILKFNCEGQKKLSGYVAIYEPKILDDGIITDTPANDEYLKRYDYSEG